MRRVIYIGSFRTRRTRDIFRSNWTKISRRYSRPCKRNSSGRQLKRWRLRQLFGKVIMIKKLLFTCDKGIAGVYHRNKKMDNYCCRFYCPLLHMYWSVLFKEWVSLFLGSWGMNCSTRQTNQVNREAVLGRFVCSALQFIPHEPRKKTPIPYIYNVSNKDLS